MTTATRPGLRPAALVAALFLAAAVDGWALQPSPLTTPWTRDVDPGNALPQHPRPMLTRGWGSWKNLNGLWDFQLTNYTRATDGGAGAPCLPSPRSWGQILVPYPLESALSGVRSQPGWLGNASNLSTWTFMYMWYRRSLTLPTGWGKAVQDKTHRVILRFGAANYNATVLVNDRLLGSHAGGYSEFQFDITAALALGGAESSVQVGVDPDATFHGKQNVRKFRRPGGISYSPSSGLWQTVWVELVPSRLSIQAAVSATSPDLTTATLDVRLASAPGAAPVAAAGAVVVVNVAATTPRGNVLHFRSAGAPAGSGAMTVPIAMDLAQEQALWTPETPHLFNLSVTVLLCAGGPSPGADAHVAGPSPTCTALDSASTYMALRTISLGIPDPGDAPLPDTHVRILLNGRFRFLIGVLDQGFWPDGIYTAATDAALAADLRVIKSMGFNAVRKHLKIEPSRWYYHCDRLGILVMQDVPSGESGFGNGGVDRQFRQEITSMVEQRRGHPSIMIWNIYNEALGESYNETVGGTAAELAYVAGVVALVRAADGTRLVNDASGWHWTGAGDMLDTHSYPQPSLYNCSSPFPSSGQRGGRTHTARGGTSATGTCSGHAFINSEFGGLTLVPSKLGRREWFQPQYFPPCTRASCPTCPYFFKGTSASGPTCCHGYGGSIIKEYGNNASALAPAYQNITRRLPALIAGGLSLAVYTQISDIETECNGLQTYDRVAKASAGSMRAVNCALRREYGAASC